MAKTQTGRLTPGVVAAAAIDDPGGVVEVVNLGSAPIWVRVDGPDPYPGAPDSYVVLPDSTRSFRVSNVKSRTTTVKLITDAYLGAYTVQGVRA